MTTTQRTAAERRIDGINSVLDSAMADGRDFTATMSDQQRIVTAIEGLTRLGRTDRWRNVVTYWASRVSEAGDMQSFKLELFQGAVYASHVA